MRGKESVRHFRQHGLRPSLHTIHVHVVDNRFFVAIVCAKRSAQRYAEHNVDVVVAAGQELAPRDVPAFRQIKFEAERLGEIVFDAYRDNASSPALPYRHQSAVI